MKILSILVAGFVLTAGAAETEVLFYTDFSNELGGKTYVDLDKGDFVAACANPGIFYKSMDGVAIVAASKEGKWPPPPKTTGAGAARIGYDYDGDFQLRLALPHTWSSSSNYTFTVSYRVGSESGKVDESAQDLVTMSIGSFDEWASWLGSSEHIVVKGDDWSSESIKVSGKGVILSKGKQMVVRIQKKTSSSEKLTIWVDSIEVTAKSR